MRGRIDALTAGFLCVGFSKVNLRGATRGPTKLLHREANRSNRIDSSNSSRHPHLRGPTKCSVPRLRAIRARMHTIPGCTPTKCNMPKPWVPLAGRGSKPFSRHGTKLLPGSPSQRFVHSLTDYCVMRPRPFDPAWSNQLFQQESSKSESESESESEVARKLCGRISTLRCKGQSGLSRDERHSGHPQH